MKITKYDNLTTEELILLATNELKDEDELSIALCARLMDVQDELDQWKADYADETADYERRVKVLREKLASFSFEGAQA